MLSLADIHHRKLLLLMPKESLDTALQLQTGTLVYKVADKKIDKIPLHSLLALFLCGRFTITSQLLKELTEHGVSVFFLGDNFALYTSCIALTKGNYLLRQKQYLLSEEQELALAKQLITYKIASQNQALGYFNKELIKQPNVGTALNANSVLGLEGSASSMYFSKMFDTMGWHQRMAQAKQDEINLLMDIGYTMLFNLTDAMLSLFGFDTYKGFYHKLFFARKSLACDLMEPARPIVDAAIVMMYRRNIFQKKDFEVKNRNYQFAGGYETRKKYATYFAKTFATYKEELFVYIRQFYFAISLPEKYEFETMQIDFSKLPESVK